MVIALATGLAVASFAVPARAQTAAPEPAAEAAEPRTRAELLDTLLLRLANSPDESSAAVVERAIWELWLTSGSDTIDLLMDRAVKAMRDRDMPLALDLLNAVVELAPDYPEGWNKRATVLFSLREYGRSLQDVERVLALEPRHFGALSGLGLIMLEIGAKEQALAAFRKALAIHPNMASALRAVKDLRDEVEGRGI
jgi:tetratricopeptide (TPR) repeat protein